MWTRWWQKIVATDAPSATWLVRLAVGGIFLSEGLQKFLFADARGSGRFTTIGLPMPEVLGPFVGVVEIVGGALVLLGAATRLAAAPLVVIMVVALVSTKWPTLRDAGFWEAAHASRTDTAMLLASLFLAAVGAGPVSVDARLGVRRALPSNPATRA